MCNIKIGQLVKFKNQDNTLNGGTLVDFVVVKDTNEKRALVNTFDAQRVTVAPERLILVKHQRGDKPTEKFISKVKKSIEESNESLKVFGPNENQIETDAEKIQKLKEFISVKEKEIKELQNIINSKTNEIEGLTSELVELKRIESNLENTKKEIDVLKKTVSVLSETIVFLKSNTESDAFTSLLEHIKLLTNVQA